MNKEINLALKHRTEEMLKGNYSKKLSEEEIYTIICELEQRI